MTLKFAERIYSTFGRERKTKYFFLYEGELEVINKQHKKFIVKNPYFLNKISAGKAITNNCVLFAIKKGIYESLIKTGETRENISTPACKLDTAEGFFTNLR